MPINEIIFTAPQVAAIMLAIVSGAWVLAQTISSIVLEHLKKLQEHTDREIDRVRDDNAAAIGALRTEMLDHMDRAFARAAGPSGKGG